MADANDYLDRVTEALALADQAGPFDLVLYNAGMDPTDSGVTAAQLREREQMVAEWASDGTTDWSTPWPVATPTA